MHGAILPVHDDRSVAQKSLTRVACLQIGLGLIAKDPAERPLKLLRNHQLDIHSPLGSFLCTSLQVFGRYLQGFCGSDHGSSFGRIATAYSNNAASTANP